MATAWPFAGEPRKFDLIASGAVPVGLTTVLAGTVVLYLAGIRFVNTDAVAIRTVSLFDANGEEIIDTVQLAPKGVHREPMDMAPYAGLKANASGAGLKYRIWGWKGTGSI